MPQHRKVAFAALAVLGGTLVLTGCGSQAATSPANTATPSPSANAVNHTNGTGDNNSTNSTNQTNNTTNDSQSNPENNSSTGTNGNGGSSNDTGSVQVSSHFPSLVKQAMATLGTNGFTGANAPTFLPQPTASGNSSYDAHETVPTTNGPQFLAGYHVGFASGGQTYAAFEVDHFASSQSASQSVLTFANALKGGKTVSGGSGIVLPNNQSASVSTSDGSTVIHWTNGNWACQVVNENTSVPPTPIADKLVSQLAANSLPTTDGTGRIIVDNANPAGTDLTVTLIWSANGNVYQVQTTSAANSPIQSALQMASSLQPYPG
ncbi:hypothetical protein C7445_10387 [Alicyclobacillus sacchari]|uniref:Uncharacterized protein n=2 Tax=Alicyclobacillus sacchari TaxID=392010 RepID=A0A4R8LR43_9BACL|nr:hypothetical protein [Alicyclobacillus sacchari]TDY50043.1 hypothetical protein C7445_10387 [Alicyclobacillus sacchari]